MARRRAEDQGQPQARSRRRSAELFVSYAYPPLPSTCPPGEGKQKRPAVICDGRPLLPRKSSATVYATQRLLIWWTGKRRGARALRDDLGGDVADAGAGQADGTGSARGEVEHASLDEGATVVDRHHDALAAMGHPELGSERQRAVGRGHGVLVEALSGGGLAAGFIAVKGGLSREARRADRGIGVHPIARGLMGVVGMVAVMPGFGG